jgi:hypothetical protein
LDCDDDRQAKDAAAKLLDGSAIELWHMGRIVCRLEPDGSSATDKPA